MESMNCLANGSSAVEFFILGFQISPEVKPIFFLLFITIYVITVTMNLFIIITVSLNEQLHTPMFFFLVNLSVLDMSYQSSVIPTILGSLKEGFSISFPTCMLQFFFEAMMGTHECFLLTVMAYDRYVAICNPFHYMTIVGWGLCFKMIVAACVLSFSYSLGATLSVCTLRFLGPNKIDHFFCDFAPLLKVACSDVSLAAIEVFITALLITIIPGMLIVASYVCIIAAILRIPSATGRRKAFSTCSSHLLVVIAFFGTLIIIYGTPTTAYSLTLNKIVSVVYTVVTPLLNPIIYTLRNKEIMDSCKRSMAKNWR